MSGLRYSREHEWVRLEGDIATIGISDFAQKQLGDVVFVELPDVGSTVNQDDEMAVVESVKAASEVYAPVSGQITEINGKLEENPGLVNESPLGEGWFARLRVSDSSQVENLMTESEYADYASDVD